MYRIDRLAMVNVIDYRDRAGKRAWVRCSVESRCRLDGPMAPSALEGFYDSMNTGLVRIISHVPNFK